MSGAWRGVTALLEGPVLLAARLLERSDAAETRARRGELPRASGGAWLHAASAGEVRGLVPLARALHGTTPLVVTAHTRAGLAAAGALLPDDPAARAPFDLPRTARRALETSGAGALILAETELWPNWLAAAAERGVRVAVVNARLSDRSIGRYRAAAGFWRPRLATIHAVAAQSEEDARRWRELGAPEAAVRVTGNMKHDLAPAAAPPVPEPFPGRTLVVLGSLRPGEAEPLARALAGVRREVPDLAVVAAPRHRANDAAVRKALEAAGFRVGARSRGGPGPGHDALLLDTMGELPSFYRLARVAVVGGTIRPFGGHNVAEPALFGVPVVFGPYTANCRLEADTLVATGAGRRAANEGELAAALRDLLGAGARDRAARAATDALGQLAGATARTLDLLAARGVVARRSA